MYKSQVTDLLIFIYNFSERIPRRTETNLDLQSGAEMSN